MMVDATHAVHWQDAIEEWMVFLRATSKPETTIGLRNYQMRRFARDHKDTPPWLVTLDHMLVWLASFNWQPETRRSYRATLRSFYHFGHVTGRIDHDPSALLPPITPPITESRPAPEEYFRAAIKQATPRVRLMVELAGFVGMRRGEVAIAHRDDVQPDLEAWSMLVHGKGRRERMVPLLPGLAMTLRSMPAGYLFPGQIDGHLSPHYVGKLISATLPPGWAAHSLRHRFSNKFFEAERDLRALQEALGHASISTTQRYTRAPSGAIRRGVGNVA